jgi:hypothetical protein
VTGNKAVFQKEVPSFLEIQENLPLIELIFKKILPLQPLKKKEQLKT